MVCGHFFFNKKNHSFPLTKQNQENKKEKRAPPEGAGSDTIAATALGARRSAGAWAVKATVPDLALSLRNLPTTLR